MCIGHRGKPATESPGEGPATPRVLHAQWTSGDWEDWRACFVDAASALAAVPVIVSGAWPKGVGMSTDEEEALVTALRADGWSVIVPATGWISFNAVSRAVKLVEPDDLRQAVTTIWAYDMFFTALAAYLDKEPGANSLVVSADTNMDAVSVKIGHGTKHPDRTAARVREAFVAAGARRGLEMQLYGF